MKTRNTIGVIALIAIIAIAIIGCKQDEPEPTPQPKQHASFHGVEVWSEVGVSDSQVATIIGYLTIIYGDFVTSEKTKWGLLTQIRIKSDTGTNKTGTVLNIGADETLDNLSDYIFDNVVN